MACGLGMCRWEAFCGLFVSELNRENNVDYQNEESRKGFVLGMILEDFKEVSTFFYHKGPTSNRRHELIGEKQGMLLGYSHNSNYLHGNGCVIKPRAFPHTVNQKMLPRINSKNRPPFLFFIHLGSLSLGGFCDASIFSSI